MALTKEAILAADDLPRRKVEVPEWGGDVYVRTMTGAERDAWEISFVPEAGGEKRDLSNIRAKLAVLACVDEQGKRLFDDADVEALGQKSASALERIVEAAGKLNALSGADLEELRGN